MKPVIPHAASVVRRSLLAGAGLALLLAAPAGAIVGGHAAPPGRWPWMAAVVSASQPDAYYGQFCGGTIIAPRRVLTAAHCVDGKRASSIAVVVGRERLTTDQGRRIAVTGITRFPGWVSGAEAGLDAAVLTLAADTGVAPVALAQPGQESAWAPATSAWTIGWGRLNGRPTPGYNAYYADRLRELALPIVGDDACENAYGAGNGDLIYRPAWIVCAGASDGLTGDCSGDSGGPLVVDTPAGWLQVGIVQSGDGCASKGFYDLFTRVDRIRAFALHSVALKPNASRHARRSGRTPHAVASGSGA